VLGVFGFTDKLAPPLSSSWKIKNVEFVSLFLILGYFL
jgi:hypothetical protein